MSVNLLIHIAEEGADAERLATLTGYLRKELLQADVADVTAPPAGEAPPGSRAIDPSLVGALLVDLGQSMTGLESVISVIRSWLGRGQPAGRGVRLQLGDDVIELSQATDADQERLVQLFIGGHSATAREPS
ncbi:MAG TPA: hypothetical protein VF838_20545 [Trebonia sp.]